jgi:hypothetical protein
LIFSELLVRQAENFHARLLCDEKRGGQFLVRPASWGFGELKEYGAI